MCYLCEEYGAGGLWYLNPENYARNMYTLRLPDGAPKSAAGAETSGDIAERAKGIVDLVVAMEQGDRDGYETIKGQMNENRRQRGTEGQVVSLEDGDKILELCSPVGLMACVCRKGARAIDERNELEYTCMGMGVGMLKWERWPERYKGGVTFVSIEEAKEWNHRMDKRGFVHLLMLAGAPYIGGFCQCDYPDCSAIRRVVDFGSVGSFGGIGTLKGHQVAQVDYDGCNGCGICAQRCQFGALKFEVTSGKANIDQFVCYGCGLCHTGCPRGAIKLLDRTSLPALVEVW
jgi:NAD-dependent dihydropyrimidine dehydrogenase PreA subunit